MAGKRNAKRAPDATAQPLAARRRWQMFGAGALGTIVLYAVYWLRHQGVMIQAMQDQPAFATVMNAVCLLILAVVAGVVATACRPPDLGRAITIGSTFVGALLAVDFGAPGASGGGAPPSPSPQAAVGGETRLAGLGGGLTLAQGKDASWFDCVRLVIAPVSTTRQYQQATIIAQNQTLRQRVGEAESAKQMAINEQRLLTGRLQEKRQEVEDLITMQQVYLDDIEKHQGRLAEMEMVIRQRDTRIEELTGDVQRRQRELSQQTRQMRAVADQLIRLGALTPWQGDRIPPKLRALRPELTETLLELGEIGEEALRRAEQADDEDLRRFVAEERRLRRDPRRPGGGG